MNKAFFQVLGVVVFLAFFGIDAFACSCIPNNGKPLSDQVAEAKRKSYAIFSGTVLGVVENRADG